MAEGTRRIITVPGGTWSKDCSSSSSSEETFDNQTAIGTLIVTASIYLLKVAVENGSMNVFLIPQITRNSNAFQVEGYFSLAKEGVKLQCYV